MTANRSLITAHILSRRIVEYAYRIKLLHLSSNCHGRAAASCRLLSKQPEFVQQFREATHDGVQGNPTAIIPFVGSPFVPGAFYG